MTRLPEIQAAIRALPRREQDALRLWLDAAPLDLERTTRKLESELLRAVRGTHRPLSKDELEAIGGRVSRERKARRTA